MNFGGNNKSWMYGVDMHVIDFKDTNKYCIEHCTCETTYLGHGAFRCSKSIKEPGTVPIVLKVCFRGSDSICIWVICKLKKFLSRPSQKSW